MGWLKQLIKLYLEICELYYQEPFVLTERFSNNNQPDFTDSEVATVYLWSHFVGHQKQKASHQYVSDHLAEWLPDLPKYSSYNDRVNRLDDFLCALTYHLLGCLPLETVPTMNLVS